MDGSNKGIQVSKYFKYRSVSSDDYSDYTPSAYFLRALPKSKEVNILDIGCGFGQMLNYLRTLGFYNLFGVDISSEGVEHCNGIGLSVQQISNLIEFTKSSEEKYDFIIMSHVLEHIEKPEIISTLSAIRTTLLKENGTMLVIVPNAQSNTGCYWAYEDFTHTTLFTSGSLFYVLKAAGFSDVEFLDIYGTDDAKGWKKILKRFLLEIYSTNQNFWNKVTSSRYYHGNPQIFSFAVKVLATK